MTTICVGLMARRRSRFFLFIRPFLLFFSENYKNNMLIHMCLLSFLKHNSVYFFFLFTILNALLFALFCSLQSSLYSLLFSVFSEIVSVFSEILTRLSYRFCDLCCGKQ